MSHKVLTPDALLMIDAIARTGSFAAAARELGKVPSALTYSVRQLEESLDVLLFDRRSRQAEFTAAGRELLHEGRRLLEQIEAVSHRVKRVATGWETQLTIAVDGVISRATVLDLCEAFYALTVVPHDGRRHAGSSAAARTGNPPASAHRGARRHLGGADLGSGRPRDRRLDARRPRRPQRLPDATDRRHAIRLRGRTAPSAGSGAGADHRR